MRGAKLTKTKLARKLRRDSTDAEQKLWNRLRSRALGGFKFVRQEPIGSYVVDFICREQKLVVEVDGGQHATDKQLLFRRKSQHHTGPHFQRRYLTRTPLMPAC